MDKDHLRVLIDKLDTLPPEQIVEVEGFVDFLLQHAGGDQTAGRLLQHFPSLIF